MGMHGGGETTMEDEVIYDYDNRADIDAAMRKLRELGAVGVTMDHRIEAVLESLVWGCVRRYL